MYPAVNIIGQESSRFLSSFEVLNFIDYLYTIDTLHLIECLYRKWTMVHSLSVKVFDP